MKRFVNERSIAFCMLFFSGIVGYLIHPFYDWTGSGQGRPMPLLWQVPLAISAALGFGCLSLPWIPLKRENDVGIGPSQFSLRTMATLIAGVAVLVAIATRSPSNFPAVALVATLLVVIFCGIRFPRDRWTIAALVGAMYLPFLWLFYTLRGEVQLTKLVPLLASLPAYVPTAFISRIWNLSENQSRMFAMAITGLETVVGLIVIRLGPKRGFAFAALALIVSMVGSLWLNAVYRM